MLFVSHLIIPLRFEVLPTTEISGIFQNISLGYVTTNQSTLKLIMKVDLIEN